jgi:hypothetical protein
MYFKILESNGVENKNTDGGAFNNFTAGGESGVVSNVLDECIITASGNTLTVATGLLLISGIRVKLTTPATISLQGTPAMMTNYLLVAKVELLQDETIKFVIDARTNQTLIKDNLYKQDKGIYEIELARFTHNTNGSISNLVRTVKILTGKSFSNDIIKDGDGTKVLNNKGEYVNLQELEPINIVIPDNIIDGYVYPNFDDYLTFGTYSVKKHQWAQVIENCPSDFAGTLTVFSASTSVNQDLKKPYRNVIQKYVDVLGDIYIRSEIVGTVDGESGVHTGWQDWKKVLTTDDEIGGSSITVDSELSDTSTNPVQNKVVKTALDGKVDATIYKGLVRAYGHDTDGNQIGHWLSTNDGMSYASGNFISPQNIAIFRNTTAGSSNVTGILVTGDPTKPYQCTNKKYVDENFSPKLYRHQIKLTKEDSEAKYMLNIAIITTSSTPLTTIEDVANAISDGLYENEYYRPAYYVGITPSVGSGLVSVSRVGTTISVEGIIKNGTDVTTVSFGIIVPSEGNPGTTLSSIVDRPIEL